MACESYYPGWHGPLTKAQQDWHRCNTPTCTATQHIAVDSMADEANGLGLPIFTIEDGVSYTTAGSPQDVWYGVNPPGPSRNLSRQGMIDLNKAEQHIPHNLALGMEWWAGEATPIPGINAAQGFWATPGIGVFDALTTDGNPMNNATLPVMAAMGGRLDPTIAYKLVSAADGGVLETPGASTAAGRGAGHRARHGHHGPAAAVADPRPGRRPRAERDDLPDADGPPRRRLLPDRQRQPDRRARTCSTAAGRGVVQSPQTAGVFSITGTNADAGVGRPAGGQLRRRPGELHGAAAGLQR